jgi:hypothetical protein
VSQGHQTIESPNEDELAWIAENLDVARSLLSVAPDGPLDPVSLDKILLAWNQQDHSERVEPNALVNALGIAFGQYLVDRLGMSWAVVTDEHGTDMAVRQSPLDILIYPTVAVAKRIESAEAPFFKDLYRKLSEDIDRIRRQAH